MKTVPFKLIRLICTVLSVACSPCFAQDLIPLPKHMQTSDGEFKFNSNITFSAHHDCHKEVKFFASELRKATGWRVSITKKGTIQFAKDKSLKNGYVLIVNKQGVKIRASDSANLFYGFQTLRQLGPASLFSPKLKAELKNGWSIPCLKISDSPRFNWRGVLLDVSRKFQTKDEILKLLDSMAMVKLNVLHWHLTDDQGWRPEIKAYPKLTAGTEEKYTQQDLTEIVAYATARGITIVPEIDVPGHSAAVARAYPEFCVSKDNGKGRHNVYDVSNPDVYIFLDTVIKELAAIFPGEYIHLGADEVHTGCWNKDPGCVAYMKKHNIKNSGALQAHFVDKVAVMISKHGRKAIAWDEALHGSDKEKLSIMSWRGVKPGIKAAQQGYQVVLCPVSALYYDRAQSRSKTHPDGYSRNTVVMSQSYFFEPAIPTLSTSTKANILGAQGCVWGEKIKSGNHMHSQVMLRGAALAESLWSPRASLNWDSFLNRLTEHKNRLDARGVPYWWEPETTPIKVGGWKSVSKSGMQEIDVSQFIKKAGLHEFLFHYKHGKGSFSISKAELLKNGIVVAEDTHTHTGTVEPRGPNQFYLLKLQKYDSQGKYTLRYRIQEIKGGCSGVVMLIPPLAEDRYSKQRGPETKGNVSDQKQPDEL